MDGRRPPPETSNFYCLPGRAGGTPNVLGATGDEEKERIAGFAPLAVPAEFARTRKAAGTAWGPRRVPQPKAAISAATDWRLMPVAGSGSRSQGFQSSPVTCAYAEMAPSAAAVSA